MSNFDFLEIFWSELADLGEKAEKQLYYDNNACIVTIGIFAEKLTEKIFESEHLQENIDRSQYERIEYLKDHRKIGERVVNLLHQIRMIRNQVGHGKENVSVGEAEDALEKAYSLGVWFFNNYSGKEHIRKDFIWPVREANSGRQGNGKVDYNQIVQKSHKNDDSSLTNLEMQNKLRAKTKIIVVLSILLAISVLINIRLMF